jgi:hypothetical protein
LFTTWLRRPAEIQQRGFAFGFDGGQIRLDQHGSAIDRIHRIATPHAHGLPRATRDRRLDDEFTRAGFIEHPFDHVLPQCVGAGRGRDRHAARGEFAQVALVRIPCEHLGRIGQGDAFALPGRTGTQPAGMIEMVAPGQQRQYASEPAQAGGIVHVRRPRRGRRPDAGLVERALQPRQHLGPQRGVRGIRGIGREDGDLGHGIDAASAAAIIDLDRNADECTLATCRPGTRSSSGVACRCMPQGDRRCSRRC